MHRWARLQLFDLSAVALVHLSYDARVVTCLTRSAGSLVVVSLQPAAAGQRTTAEAPLTHALMGTGGAGCCLGKGRRSGAPHSVPPPPPTNTPLLQSELLKLYRRRAVRHDENHSMQPLTAAASALAVARQMGCGPPCRRPTLGEEWFGLIRSSQPQLGARRLLPLVFAAYVAERRGHRPMTRLIHDRRNVGAAVIGLRHEARTQ